MFSNYNTSLKGLIFSILFYCTAPFVYFVLIGMLMYGDEAVIRVLTFDALFLVSVFLLITAVAFVLFIRQVKKQGYYSSFGTLVFYAVLLFISYPLIILSPFINLHIFGSKVVYIDALILNYWVDGSVFLLLGIALDILKYRINKEKVLTDQQ